jgi:hypothetical protein
MNKTTHTINLPTFNKAEVSELFKELAKVRKNYTAAKPADVERAIDKIKTKIHKATA